jgi:integrase
MSDERRIRVWVQARQNRPFLTLEWHDPITGRRKGKSAGTADEKLAETKRADREADLNAGRHQESSNISWERFRELFEAEYVSGVRPNTRTNFTATFDVFERLARPGKLRSVSERTLSTFVAALRREPTRGREGMMPSTIKVRLQFLRTALLWAVGQNLIPKCPKFPRVKVPKKDPQPVPAETFERLVNAAPDANMRTYLLTAWLGGLRLDEAYSMTWEASDAAPWLDLPRNLIVFPAEYVKAARDQWVPLDPVLRQALEELTPDPAQRTGRVFSFPAWGKGENICAAAVSDRVSRLAKRVGVRPTYHTLRKGFGCRYAAKVPAQVLQRLMRHQNIRTTVGFYTNVDDAVVEAVMGAQRGAGRGAKDSADSNCQNGQDVTGDVDDTSTRS